MSQITITNEEIIIKVESELEKKVDRILELLENKEASTSVEIDTIKVGQITDELIEKYNLQRFGYSKTSTPGSTSL